MDFANAILPYNLTSLSPYKLELGFKPQLPFKYEERTRDFKNPTKKLN